MKNLAQRLALVASCLCAATAYAQETPKSDQDLYDLSLEELLNIPINSASKKDETLFDAPLSSYTVTRADIERAGSTSIMEALRLVPGLIVREQSNGVYDIHVRGLDNLLRYSEAFSKNNLYTLVMIDSRPAFNHNLGGTFWEALPIDLNDVERIEIVRGPSAPLFGPNAVTGVVNIITRRANAEETTVTAKVEGGAPATVIANAFVGRKFSERFNSAVSFNYQDRSRYNDLFYRTSNGDYADGKTFIGSFNKRFPNASRAVQRTGVNGYFQFTPSEKTSFDLSLGYQSNEALKNMLAGGGTILNATLSNSVYANLAAKISGLSIRTSYVQGKDNIQEGGTPAEYDYQVTDLNAEYTIKVGKNVSVVPGVGYQNAAYSDKAYFSALGEGFLSGTRQTISTLSGYVRSDINLTSKWRALAALRADQFSTPDALYLAYEFATTYKLNDNNIIRFAATRSNSGAFMGYNKLNYIDKGGFNLVGDVYIDQVQRGRNDLKLLTVNMLEIGYRTKLSSNLQLDVDVFQQKVENLTTFMPKGFDSFPPSLNSNFVVEFDNVPVTATQVGTTIGLNFVPDTKWQVKPSITVQSTQTFDLPSYYIDPTLATTQPGVGFPVVTYSDSKHKYTPAVYGGYYINFKPNEKFNINLNGYFLGSQTWYRSATENVDSKAVFLVNLKVNYAIARQVNVYLNGRNILNNQNPQFLGGDKLGALVMGGISFNLK